MAIASVGPAVLALWRRLPVIVRAVLSGAFVATVGTGGWVLLSLANQRFLRVVPWAIVPTSIFLWLYWRWLGGEGWPSATSQARRMSLRANSVSGDAWGMSLFAGMLGYVTLLPLVTVLGRLVRLPAEAQPITTPPDMPAVTVLLLLLMASVVAGVVEEAAFRGYLQGPIERRHGPTFAILFTGTLFGFAHFTHHPTAVVAMLPYYIYIAALYGGLAYLTNSIWPGLVLHAVGDVFSLTRLWATGQPEWRQTSQAPLIWNSGGDFAFYGALAALIVLGAATAWAYMALAAAVRQERASAGPSSSPVLL